jgi:tetratricopeptide (TPR) repeat protein
MSRLTRWLRERQLRRRSDLADAMLDSYLADGRAGDLLKAQEAATRALESAPDDSPMLPQLITRLGAVLAAGAESGADIAEIDAAFRPARVAVERASGHEPGLVRAALGEAVYGVCEVVGWPAGLDEAVDSYRAAIGEGPDRSDLRHDLGVALLQRFEWTGDPHSVSEAVATLRVAVAGTDPGTPDRDTFDRTLGSALLSDYEVGGDAASLTEAVAILEALLDRVVRNELDATTCRISLAVALETRARETSAVADVESAIELLTQALADTGDEDDIQPVIRLDLANALSTSYELTGDLEQVRQAVSHLRTAAAALTAASPVRASTLSSLSNVLLELFAGEERPEDLAEAVAAARLAVGDAVGTEPGFAGYLGNLAIALLTAHESSGRPELLDEAVGYARDAVAAAPLDRAGRANALACLGQCLCAAHEATGELAPLDEAITHQRLAVAETPQTDLFRAPFLSNLAISLCLRHEHTPDDALLQTALDTARDAVAATPDGDPYAHLYLQTLDRVLRERYRVSGSAAALDEAIDTMRTAVRTLDGDDPARPACLMNLAASLLEHHSLHAGNTELEEAVELLGQSLATESPDAPERAMTWYNLGLARAAGQEGDPGAASAAVSAFREAVAVETAPPLLRAESAVEWGRAAAAAELWGVAAEGFRAAVALLPLVSPRHLDRGDQEHLLDLVDGAARDAAACLLEAGIDPPMSAVEIIEQGRGVLLGTLAQPAGDLARLRAAQPALADLFEQVRDEFDSRRSYQMIRRSQGHSAAPAAHLAAQQASGTRRALSRTLDELVARIRALPDLDGFLRPVSPAQVTAAVDQDTVILVNVSRYRSDALVLRAGEVTVIPLRDLDWQTLTEITARYPRLLAHLRRAPAVRASLRVSEALRELCGWLWVTIARPVLDETGHDAPGPTHWPRVWWCLTGPLASLPLHAAHPYEAASGVRDGVAERVVSSYLPTLRTLAELRSRQPDDARSVRALVVAVPGATEPGHAEREIRAVAAAFGEPPLMLRQGAATRAAVLDTLPRHQWLHFIGHSYQDLANPALGGMRLADGDLTALEFASVRLTGAALAYLSSCEGATGGARTTDDPLHPALACLVAGFRHVIGTLWSVGDSAAADVAEQFYRRLTVPGAESGAEPGAESGAGEFAHLLHAAVRAMRMTHPPEVWAAYIHVGA